MKFARMKLEVQLKLESFHCIRNIPSSNETHQFQFELSNFEKISNFAQWFPTENGGSQTWFLKNPKSSIFGKFFYHVFQRWKLTQTNEISMFFAHAFSEKLLKQTQNYTVGKLQEKMKILKNLFFHRNQRKIGQSIVLSLFKQFFGKCVGEKSQNFVFCVNF